MRVINMKDAGRKREKKKKTNQRKKPSKFFSKTLPKIPKYCVTHTTTDESSKKRQMKGSRTEMRECFPVI